MGEEEEVEGGKKKRRKCDATMFMGKIFRGQDIYEINGFQATAKYFMLFTDADILECSPKQQDNKMGFLQLQICKKTVTKCLKNLQNTKAILKYILENCLKENCNS